MKICVETHTVTGFGVIPEGSLWADDSPFVVEVDKCAPVETTPAPVRKKPAVRKFGQPVEATDGD